MHSSLIFKSEIFHLNSLKLNYIEIDEILLAKTLSLEEKNTYNQRFLIRVNNSETWHAGVVALGNNKGYITVKTSILKKNKLQVGDIVQVHLEKDTSEFGMEFPEELRELLQQDIEGNNRFLQLSKGKQRYIIYYISQVKSSQKRLDRAILLISNLKKTPLGKEEFRFLLGKF